MSAQQKLRSGEPGNIEGAEETATKLLRKGAGSWEN